MTFKVTFSTMGVSTPASVAEDAGSGGYKYRGDPNWKPGAPQYRESGQGEPLPHNAAATGAKQKRMAEYNRRRLNGSTKEEAAAGCAPQGVSRCTMLDYEREFKGSLDQIAAQSPEHAALVAEFRRRQEPQP